MAVRRNTSPALWTSTKTAQHPPPSPGYELVVLVESETLLLLFKETAQHPPPSPGYELVVLVESETLLLLFKESVVPVSSPSSYNEIYRYLSKPGTHSGLSVWLGK